MPGDWSRREVELIVDDHLGMLAAEMRGERVNKAVRRRALRALLDGRSDGSVEYKHQNVSAALVDAGFRHLTGYLPAFNYQSLVAEVVGERLAGAADLASLLAAEVTRGVEGGDRPVSEMARPLIEIPMPSRGDQVRVVRDAPPGPRRPVKINFLELEARNASLGLAGETLILDHEARRLHAAGARHLADRVENVSRSRGDGLGYDVLSFEVDGTPRHIEVKTTRYSRLTPFFVSANELRTSHDLDVTWWLYRVFDFAAKPGFFTKAGPVDAAFPLTAVSWQASIP